MFQRTGMETRRALVCSLKMPEFDREGGSRRVFHLIEFLQEAGWAVSFITERGGDGERYARVLQQKGVPVYVSDKPWPGGEQCLINPADLIATGNFDLVIIAFWHVAERYIPIIRSVSPNTRIVTDSIDLHFLRESRSILQPNGNGSSGTLDANFALELMRELNAYAAADAVFTVSQKEADLVNDFVDKKLAYAIPDTDDAPVSDVPYAERKGMLFVGNFRHAPNVQAVEFLCHSILPRLHPEILEEHPVYIVGTDPTETVLNCCKETVGVRLIGWVPSVLPYLQRSRISLIPLLYGAGTKRKLMQSLMVGTPSVSTNIGIEGFNLQDNVHVLVANDAEAFANSITSLIRDEELWHRLARQGERFIREAHGRDVVFARFSSVINTIMGSPPEAPEPDA